jgi:four helix bundle protein
MATRRQGGVCTYRDLIAWQKAMRVAEKVYHVTKRFPEAERFGMVSQMRRSAVGIPSNIAEGFGRARKAEFRRFLEIGKASLFELQTQAELARRLGWIKGEALSDLRDSLRELDAVMSGLIRSTRRTGSSSGPSGT